jgi:uncharacterized membrane protein
MKPPRRLGLVDALRGFAIVQMVGFHFTYLLDRFGWVEVAVNRDQPFAAWRIAIVTQFLLLVGVGLALRPRFDPSWHGFWRRWSQIAGAAALVSAGSFFFLGPRFVYFGILHFVAAALLMAWPLVGLGAGNLALGFLALAIGSAFSDPFFDSAPASVLGFVTQPPSTEDFVPIFPWIGVVLIGSGLGALWRARGFAIVRPLRALDASPPRVLALLGRWPLTAYLAHVPILVAGLWVFGALLR